MNTANSDRSKSSRCMLGVVQELSRIAQAHILKGAAATCHCAEAADRAHGSGSVTKFTFGSSLPLWYFVPSLSAP